ncbi:hypothetical protein BT63DRAFT_154838 [Microthyrium microscopicum]|uniref:Cell wall mannoprotein PIR1-like C-terminal domain-containing protein n=1 Tax=Microthyrium microscopicum TaxID=703497 RepID=A0A6A6UPJ7_9PEZI|nr:hypothetical protein BT63DRAFT_154838 [Microthyrium microscopicum]
MRFALVVSALALAVTATPQGVTQYIAPPGNAPAGCKKSMDGKYELSVEPLGPKTKRMSFDAQKMLQVNLIKGTLTDDLARTGYIADNYQFQFDGPPQAGALYTGGWTLCNNGSLALGSSTVFYQCLSGSFYNLYDRWWASQCNPINIVAHAVAGPEVSSVSLSSDASLIPASSGSPSSSGGAAKATSDAMGGMTMSGGSMEPTADSSLLSASATTSGTSATGLNRSISPSASVTTAPKASAVKASAASATSNGAVPAQGSGASKAALLLGLFGMMVA